MSVTTKADEHVNQAKLDVQRAIESLGNVVIQTCWGYEEYSKEGKNRLKQSLEKLLEVRETLGESRE